MSAPAVAALDMDAAQEGEAERVRDMLVRLIALDGRRLDVHSLCDVATRKEAVIQAKSFTPHVVLMTSDSLASTAWKQPD